ncbi:hypothetical protein JCM9140_1176 [Halalkalibacter wakoensis JCM 9140]|uniref:YwiC-like protein n=1 Tax=Halalkalibacter wakoensis JCM 9140 TaxID=1236970 RepID=W4PZD1_9BACI|nr:YwiC-like family protein [Halalkalibacter wakoensis]GAE25196.1 hypothetical protein JCM9140_1176 [Halalkalibacter wakoensis JCM 9140]
MVIPKEHGTWLMFFLPLFLGMFLSSPDWMHIPFLIGWFFIYLSSTPFLTIFRNRKQQKKMFPWLFIYGFVAIIFLVPVLWYYPILFLLSFILIPLSINIYFIKKKNERTLLNNLSAIMTFSFGGASVFLIGNGEWSSEVIYLVAWVVFYFMGSTFYVKSMIRERKNLTFKKTSHVYHATLLVIPWLLTVPIMAIAFFPGVIKDWITPRTTALKPIVIGMIELANGVVFLVLSLIILS